MQTVRNRGNGAIWLAAAVVVSLLLVATSPIEAQESAKQEFTALASSLQGTKPAADDPDFSRYEELSALLGGDDPANLLGVRGSTPAKFLKSAPAAPPGGSGSTTTNFANTTVTAIPDVATVTSDIVVSGVDTFLWDLDLTTDITHTFNGDLDITLTSPGGTTVTVTTDNGGGNDDVFAGTLFDDSAADTVTDFAYANLVTATPLVPEGAMGAFIGEDPNGTWTLSITDDTAADIGNLNSWSLDVTTLPAVPVAAGPTGFTNSTVTAIPDNTTVTSDIVVAGLDTFLCDVNLTTNITHTFAADLDITLTSPGGTTVTISTDNGGGADDVFAGTLFDDSAADTVTDYTYTDLVTATPLVPEGALAAFIGEDPNGTWTLTITDDAGGDIGNLNTWSLDIETCQAAAAAVRVPTSGPLGLSLLIFALGLAGFLLVRRNRLAQTS
jgi:subtilisin-like proprotein convertase family protein